MGVEGDLHICACAGRNVDSLESLERLDRSVRVVEALDINLGDLVACEAAGIGYRDGDVDRLAGLDLALGELCIAVFEGGVAQAVAECVKRLALEIPV